MNLPASLGDHLILRRAETHEDIERIIELDNAVVQANDPNLDLSGWIRALTDGHHPTTTIHDFYLVEDTRKGLFVSSMCLIPQTWAYEGIPFGVGRPEIVMTLPEYRRRGLVRAQFEALHADCARRDLPVQGITGIPNFYRQFGYEYALDLDAGWVGLHFDLLPNLDDGAAEHYSLRKMAEADLPAVMDIARAFDRDLAITCLRDETYWRFLVHEALHVSSSALYVLVETASDRVIGYVGLRDRHWGPWLAAVELALAKGVSYLEVTPALLRAMRALADTDFARPIDPSRQLAFWLGREHPIYNIVKRYGGSVRTPYAWYLRVPDLPGFIRRIAPALERRLAASSVAGYSGELSLSFYREPGVRMKWERGRLVETGIVEPGEDSNAAFPPLVFLKLLFGYRTLEELRYAFPDVWAWGECWTVLEALFPKRLSCVVPAH